MKFHLAIWYSLTFTYPDILLSVKGPVLMSSDKRGSTVWVRFDVTIIILTTPGTCYPLCWSHPRGVWGWFNSLHCSSWKQWRLFRSWGDCDGNGCKERAVKMSVIDGHTFSPSVRIRYTWQYIIWYIDSHLHTQSLLHRYSSWHQISFLIYFPTQLIGWQVDCSLKSLCHSEITAYLIAPYTIILPGEIIISLSLSKIYLQFSPCVSEDDIIVSWWK